MDDLTLAPELLDAVFSFAALRTLKQLRTCSKHFNEIATAHLFRFLKFPSTKLHTPSHDLQAAIRDLSSLSLSPYLAHLVQSLDLDRSFAEHTFFCAKVADVLPRLVNLRTLRFPLWLVDPDALMQTGLIPAICSHLSLKTIEFTLWRELRVYEPSSTIRALTRSLRGLKTFHLGEVAHEHSPWDNYGLDDTFYSCLTDLAVDLDASIDRLRRSFRDLWHCPGPISRPLDCTAERRRTSLQ